MQIVPPCRFNLHERLQLVQTGQQDHHDQVAGAVVLQATVPRFYVCVACGSWSQARVFTPRQVAEPADPAS